MESHSTTRCRLNNFDARFVADENRRPVWSGSRDPSPIVRRDFVTSPWKRFRPAVDQPRRRPLSSSSRNLRDFPGRSADAAKFSAEMQLRGESRLVRARCPGFTTTNSSRQLAAASSTSQRRPHLLSNIPSSVDFRSHPVTDAAESSHHVESAQSSHVHARHSGFSIRTDSLLRLAGSTGKQIMSVHFYYLRAVGRKVL